MLVITTLLCGYGATLRAFGIAHIHYSADTTPFLLPTGEPGNEASVWFFY